MNKILSDNLVNCPNIGNCFAFFNFETTLLVIVRNTPKLQTTTDIYPRPLQIKSDYHSTSYRAKNLDTWMYTNSTEVTLSYPAQIVGPADRFGQLKAIKIILRG